MVFVGLSLPLLLFRFCEVFTWFYFFIYLAQAQLPHAGLSVLIWKMSPFCFAMSCALGSHATPSCRLWKRPGFWGWSPHPPSGDSEELHVVRNLTSNVILKRKENSSFYCLEYCTEVSISLANYSPLRLWFLRSLSNPEMSSGKFQLTWNTQLWERLCV